jgi:hypothetical protein
MYKEHLHDDIIYMAASTVLDQCNERLTAEEELLRFNVVTTKLLNGRYLKFNPFHVESRDSSVGIALGCGLDDRCSRARFPAGAGNFSLKHRD